MSPNPHLYAAETEKPTACFVEEFVVLAEAKGFVINNTQSMNMKETFTRHGSEVPKEFDLHMIQLCKPPKASKSLTANPERSILMPKFVHVFSGKGKTQVRFLGYGSDEIADLVKDDPAFPDSLAQTYEGIRNLINQAL